MQSVVAEQIIRVCLWVPPHLNERMLSGLHSRLALSPDLCFLVLLVFAVCKRFVRSTLFEHKVFHASSGYLAACCTVTICVYLYANAVTTP